MMTPEEVKQLINEKVAIAISVYETIRNINARNEAVRGQETIRDAKVKRKQDRNQGKNTMQHQNKKQKVVETYEEEKNIKKGYLGNHPYCGRCGKHHPGRCTIVCSKCQKMGHKAKNCRISAPIAKTVATGACYKCREMGHHRNNCPKLKRPMSKKIQEEAHMMIPKKVVETEDTEKRYKGSHPYCTKCDMHHNGRCTIICNKCRKVGHKAKDCGILAPVPITAIPIICYECGKAGHFKRNCLKLKKQNAEGKVYMITDGEDHQKLEQNYE